HTYENTTFKLLGEGMEVNIEFDLIGKYIERMISHTPPGSSGITTDKLASWGYGTR
ncbi:MAG: riboflavin synthase, partial [Ignavibacteriae bacterium]|nr:riboflavin synthase [Ignavibacteriota bacterium]